MCLNAGDCNVIRATAEDGVNAAAATLAAASWAAAVQLIGAGVPALPIAGSAETMGATPAGPTDGDIDGDSTVADASICAAACDACNGPGRRAAAGPVMHFRGEALALAPAVASSPSSSPLMSNTPARCCNRARLPDFFPTSGTAETAAAAAAEAEAAVAVVAAAGVGAAAWTAAAADAEDGRWKATAPGRGFFLAAAGRPAASCSAVSTDSRGLQSIAVSRLLVVSRCVDSPQIGPKTRAVSHGCVHDNRAKTRAPVRRRLSRKSPPLCCGGGGSKTSSNLQCTLLCTQTHGIAA